MSSSANKSNVLAKILGITVLLFGLTAQLSAQGRSDEQSLEGLRNIVVVVKYGHVDGQQKEWQSNILQRLEERARQKLWEAEVPVFQSAEETDIAGRPRLVFTVNLNRVTDTAPPVDVETELRQRVRLWRDSANESERATWTMHGGGGPMVTEQMVVEVFDGQVSRFIKTYRDVNPSSQIPSQATRDTSAQLSDTPNALQGLNGIRFGLGIRSDHLSPPQPALEKLLQEAAENKFKEAGIQLIRYADEEERAGFPLLRLWIKLSTPAVHYSWEAPIDITSGFSQRVRLVRDPKKHADVVTWESRGTGSFVKADDGKLVITDEAVLEVVNGQVDEFIKAYKAANPTTMSALPQEKSNPPRP